MANSLTTWFGWASSSSILPGSTELPDIFPLSIKEADFVRTDVVNVYKKILVDVVERTQGMKPDTQNMLWDNCLQSESADGLISMLAKAMASKEDLFIVWEPALKLLRRANHAEAEQIKTDYKAQGKSGVGTFVSFKNYSRTDMVKLYSALEYATIGALNKNMNLSKAIQFKMNDLRASTGLTDSAQVSAQAKDIATGLANGKDCLLDGKDSIETATPDLESVERVMQFLNEKRSFYLGMPASYVTGQAAKGLGDSGEGDAKAVERGLKNYYFSILKPVLEAIFGEATSFKSHDFRLVTSAMEALRTFELIGEEMISAEDKKLIVRKLLDLPDEE
jgi:hypothetical protein